MQKRKDFFSKICQITSYSFYFLFFNLCPTIPASLKPVSGIVGDSSTVTLVEEIICASRQVITEQVCETAATKLCL